MIETLKNCIIYVLNQLTVKTLFPNGCLNFVWPYTAWGLFSSTSWIKWSLSWNIHRLYVWPSSKTLLATSPPASLPVPLPVSFSQKYMGEQYAVEGRWVIYSINARFSFVAFDNYSLWFVHITGERDNVLHGKIGRLWLQESFHRN